ncbi:MAG: S24 family peptidase [Thermodesulfobacteriota bacterium]
MTLFNLNTSPRDRLLFLQETHCIESRRAFAAICGLSVHTIKGILKRDRIGSKSAARIARAFSLNYRWVRYGEEPMSWGTLEGKGTVRLPGLKPAQRKQTAVVTSEITNEARDYISVSTVRPDLAADGRVRPEQGGVPQKYAFRAAWLNHIISDPQKAILMDVDGDSMSPTLQDKDTVLIDLSRKEIVAEGIYAVAVANVIQLKRLSILPGGQIRVIADNPAYHSYTASAGDLHVIGRMIWFGRAIA